MSKLLAMREITPPTGAPPRYCEKVFPPYRYVPGLHPHPVAHPQGHSYHPAGQHPPAQAWVPPERWSESLDYLYGNDLYNNGYWWEAHEAWEGLWQQTEKGGPQGRFLQGLIQISAAHLKNHVGHAEGVERLLARAFEHLESARTKDGIYMGLDLDDFMARARRYFAELNTPSPFIVLEKIPC